MTGFSFSLEQIRSAPPEVRRWVEREIAASLASIAGSHDAAPAHAATLAACMPDEAAQFFELIKGDFLLAQVFFELGRDSPDSHAAAPLHVVAIGDLLRHTRLGSADRLGEYFAALNQAFRTIRNDPEAMLFGFDDQGHVLYPRGNMPQHPPVMGAAFCGTGGAGGRRTPCHRTDGRRVHSAASRTERSGGDAHTGLGRCRPVMVGLELWRRTAHPGQS